MLDNRPDVNVQDILARSVSPATLEDLQRKGMKSVLVLNKDNVKLLIAQAVEAAIERRAKDRVADALRVEAERGKHDIERMIQDHEQTLASQQLLVADRSRLERELSGMRETLAERVRTLEAEKQKLIEASKAELDHLLTSTRQNASQLPELKASVERMAGEVRGLRERLDAAEQARQAALAAKEQEASLRARLEGEFDATRRELDETRKRTAAYEQVVPQMEQRLLALLDQRAGLDTAGMEGLLNRFKAGLALELTQTIGTAGGKSAEGLDKVTSAVASSHVQRAFDEPLVSNLGTVTPETRSSDAGERLARIRRRLAESRSKTPGET